MIFTLIFTLNKNLEQLAIVFLRISLYITGYDFLRIYTDITVTILCRIRG